MPKLTIQIHIVKVSAPVAGFGDNASFGELGNDVNHLPLGDPDFLGNLPHQHFRITHKANQHVGVICQKSPAWS